MQKMLSILAESLSAFRGKREEKKEANGLPSELKQKFKSPVFRIRNCLKK